MRELTEADVRDLIDRTRLQTWALFYGCLFVLVLVLLAFFGITAAAALIVLIVGIVSALGAVIVGRMAFTFDRQAMCAIADLPDIANDPEAFERRHIHVLQIRLKNLSLSTGPTRRILSQ